MFYSLDNIKDSSFWYTTISPIKEYYILRSSLRSNLFINYATKYTIGEILTKRILEKYFLRIAVKTIRSRKVCKKGVRIKFSNYFEKYDFLGTNLKFLN